MEYHFFLDNSLFTFSKVFLEKMISAPFIYIEEDFTYGKLTGTSRYKESDSYLKFPISSCYLTKKRKLEKLINVCVGESIEVFLWTNSLHLNQECLILEILSILNKNKVKIKIIDLAKSRQEQPTESTHNYYYSLYRNADFIVQSQKNEFLNRKQELENQGGLIRVRFKGSLINVKYEHFDKNILGCTTETPKNSLKILVEAITITYREGYLLPGDFFIIQRLYFLVNTGKIKSSIGKLSPNNWGSMAFKRIS